jgi:hypothetical protein
MAGSLAGDGTILNSSDQYSFAAVDSGVGVITVTFPAHPDGANFVCLASGYDYHVLVRDKTSTSVVLYSRNTSNIGADRPIVFVILA